MKSARKKTTRKPRKMKVIKKVAPELIRYRRYLVRNEDGTRLIPRREWLQICRATGPVVAAVEWVERHADGFDRLALLIDAVDYMNERRHIDSDAANHVAVGLTMLREELHELRKRLWA